ncbi:MAG: hypothetical protein COC01_02620 [Bacteroidetes bacterium]|nr:MAG: hypothetical protein COC01_02620 [Bacteroidota bacterium]
MSLNHYEILGIDSNATSNEVKTAFRKKAKIYHPDINKTKEGHQMTLLLMSAYQILGDDSKRALYDMNLQSSINKKRYHANATYSNFSSTSYNRSGSNYSKSHNSQKRSAVSQDKKEKDPILSKSAFAMLLIIIGGINIFYPSKFLFDNLSMLFAYFLAFTLISYGFYILIMGFRILAKTR